jgi:hypothetical protein
VLTLTSSGATAPLSQWQAALEAVQFSSPATAQAGSRTISFAVNDGTDMSAVATKTLGVANIPFVPAKMPHAAVELTAADDNSVTTANQDVAAVSLIVLTALDPQELASTSLSVQTVTFSSGSSAGGAPNGAIPDRGLFGGSALSSLASNVLQHPGPLLSSRSWLSSPIDLQGPIGVQVPTEHLDFASQQTFSLALSPPTHDGDGQDATSTISLEQSDGSPLPAWMHYDAATGVVSGIAPGGGPREIHIVVITRHSSGATTRRDVFIDFSVRGTPSAHGSSVQPRAPHAALHSAKPSLTEQFASQRSALHVSRLSHTTRPNQVA